MGVTSATDDVHESDADLRRPLNHPFDEIQGLVGVGTVSSRRRRAAAPVTQDEDSHQRVVEERSLGSETYLRRWKGEDVI